ncbi:MAG: glyoxalase/bleomycin resistance/extradiol dioxygenase family protein [Rhodospirillaceae bacterium]|nr:glyoxalase/bleomycin resistance/extradiol dioxygenase family protein [Rhodospirillaceae bacterium]|tara:strand:- start:21425 stop:22279 length:855 start_codon:yes stop_codon:yes gene_type:complete
MIEIIDLAYLRVGAANLDEAAQFATETIGLQEVRREDDRVYVRGDDRDHDICYVQGGVEEHVVGFEVSDEASMESAFDDLSATGVEVGWGSEKENADRRVGKFFKFFDPTGNKFEIVLRPQKSPRRYFPTRDAGISEFSHVGLKTTDAPRDEKFWTTHFNIRPNDWIGDAGLLSFDSVHHRIALFPADKPGIQHINFQVDSIDDVMRSYYYLSDKQVHIVFGPGRHVTSGAMFLYYEGPDDMIYEYSHGVKIIDDPNYRPRQFPFTPDAFCAWGAKPDIPEFRD